MLAMLRIHLVHIVVALILVDSVLSLQTNQTLNDVENTIKNVETRRRRDRKKKHLSTSSSSERHDDSGDDESLDLSSSSLSTSSSGEAKKRYKPKSSLERKGWRKWHRKCQECPEDMHKKWRDPSISWICGAYQRARRSFKSLCMMHYRNCQDGTMFVKVHEHRCANDSGPRAAHGDHFFYEYSVLLSDESATFSSDDTSDESSSA